MSRCIWRGNAWRPDDACKAEATVGEKCDAHVIGCACCAGRATHECHACLQFVCGAPLCDDCEHEPEGYSYKHRRKA